MIMAWFFVALMLPGDTLLISSFKAFRNINPDENVWAAAFATAALIGVIGLFTKAPWARGLSATVLSVAHSFVGVLFFFAGRAPDVPVNTGQGTYPIIAGLGVFLCYKSMFR